jgi:iron complex outermembrane recepter protein
MKRGYRTLLVLAVLWGGLTSVSVSAGEPPDASSPAPLSVSTEQIPVYRIPFEMVITATRLGIPLKENPAATTVVGLRQLKTMPRAYAADEALKTVPGLRIDNQADGARIHMSIRGQGILTERGVRGIKVLLDGLPLNDPTGVAPDLYDVDWATVDHVEVLRGPSAAFYGGGGSGGVVNITTADGSAASLGGRATTTLGSHGFVRALAEAGGTPGKLDYRVSFSRGLGDGYRDHTAFSSRNAYEKIQWAQSDAVHLTQILGWTDYFDENAEGLNIDQVRENPRQANPDAEKYNEFYNTNRLYTGIIGQFEVARNMELQCVGYARDTRFKESVPSSVRHRSMMTPGLTIQYSLSSGSGGLKNHVSIGSDIQWQTIDEYRLKNLGGAREDTLLSNQTIDQRGTGIFLLDRIEIGEQWGIMLSGRYDDMHNELTDLMAGNPDDLSGSADFQEGTGRVGLAYTPAPQANLYANWGQGFLPPTTEELANNPEHLGGFNMGLEPATSQGGEIGARGDLGKRLSYDLAVFHLTTEHDFDRYRVPEPERELETFYRNLGSSRRYGLELLLRTQPVQPLCAEVAYTYGNFKYTLPDSLDGNWLPNSPEHQLTADLEVEPLHGLTCGITCEVQTRWQIDKENSASVNGFTLWGARASYAWHVGGLAGDVNIAGRNIFGYDYIAFTEPDPDGNSYQPGPKEEVFAGVSVQL